MYLLRFVLVCSFFAFISCQKKKEDKPGAPVTYIKINDVTLIRDSVNSTMRFTVSLEPSSQKEVKVNYTTVEGTAKSNTDFIPKSGTLTISPSTSQAFIDVEVVGRKLKQSTQEFYLQLSNPVNGTIQDEKGAGVIQNPGFEFELVWNNEFNGTGLSQQEWNYEIGNGSGGWGNNELQYYTARPENVFVNDSNLVIEARKEAYQGFNYTSARITTKGKKEFKYGRVDIRAKLPVTKGIWPALWMLGTDINQVGWPACGEIDIMELIGREPNRVFGTVHWAGPSGATNKGGNKTLASGDYSDDYHVFSILWEPDHIKWFIDNEPYFEIRRSDISGNYPFNKEFFFIFNVAVGGNWPGSPDSTSVFPQRMYVDYIRVYQK